MPANPRKFHGSSSRGVVSVVAAALALAACTPRAQDPAVRAELAALCNQNLPANAIEAAAFQPPPLELIAGDSPVATAGRWRWINVWATWCTPCRAELPLLRQWMTRLAAAGQPMELSLVNVDVERAAFERFDHTQLEGANVSRLKRNDELPGLLRALGAPEGSPIPVHALIDPQGRVRCTRTGAIREEQFATVQRMIEASP